VNQDLLHKLLAAGVKHGASDIHFRPGAPPMYRVKKMLAPLKAEPLQPAHTEAIARLIAGRALTKVDIDEVQELDISYSVPGVARFRVNIYRQRGSFAAVLRIIPSEIPTVQTLGLPPVLDKIAEVERGLVLLTGATGSGKSSTLAAMIHRINQLRMAHILTIEDPIEFLHGNLRSSISQREIGLDTRNYVTGLRAALRQDPDVILVGEMRDAESIDIALKAAETGHVVFSTVHTTDAPKTIGRILSVFPGDEQHTVRQRLAENLRATISQRLLPRSDGTGLVAACEVMIVTGSIREVILDPEQGSIKDLIEQGRQHHNMQSFDQHLTDLYTAGVITKDVALEAATNAADFERNLAFV
jgi:twitching motility protein PilT